MKEVEIKFRIQNMAALNQKLKAAGFKLKTRRTHEFNTLYDLPNGSLRSRGELLRIRKYGATWTVTHKSKGEIGRHKSRVETETRVEEGEQLAAIVTALGYAPTFRYEKFRTEWVRGSGHVVVDETPIGNIAEIEGTPLWIDRIAKTLGIKPSDYCVQSYAELFDEWSQQHGSNVKEMTWKAIGGKKPRS